MVVDSISRSVVLSLRAGSKMMRSGEVQQHDAHYAWFSSGWLLLVLSCSPA